MEVGSRRKCFCWILPVVVSTVTTGKPICRVQRSMMVLILPGNETFLLSTACGEKLAVGPWRHGG